MQYRMIDPNNTQYKQDIRRLQSLRGLIVLWLIVLALGIFLIPLMLINTWVRNDVARLESEILTVRSVMSSTMTLDADVVKLTADIAAAEQLAANLISVTVPSGVDWPRVMDVTTRFDPTSIEITSLTQAADKIQIAGRATNNDAVVRYQQILIDARIFQDVVVISMSAVPPPTPPPGEGEDNTPPVDLPFGSVEFSIDALVGSNTTAPDVTRVNAP